MGETCKDKRKLQLATNIQSVQCRPINILSQLIFTIRPSVIQCTLITHVYSLTVLLHIKWVQDVRNLSNVQWSKHHLYRQSCTTWDSFSFVLYQSHLNQPPTISRKVMELKLWADLNEIGSIYALNLGIF